MIKEAKNWFTDWRNYILVFTTILGAEWYQIVENPISWEGLGAVTVLMLAISAAEAKGEWDGEHRSPDERRYNHE